jgi:hypothetical protein
MKKATEQEKEPWKKPQSKNKNGTMKKAIEQEVEQ